jgi:hypothetical protein
MSKHRNYAEEIRPYRERVEHFLALLEIQKEKFAEAHEEGRLEDANPRGANIQGIALQIAETFHYTDLVHPKFQTGKSKDFRQDQQLRKLIVRMFDLIAHLKEDTIDLSLRDFMYHTDQVEKQVYLILQRCEGIAEAGIDQTPPARKGVKTTKVLRENFSNWKQLVKDKKREKNDRADDQGDNPLDKVAELVDQIKSF